MLAQRAASEGPRWTRAVEDQSAPIPGEITSKLGRIILGHSLQTRRQREPDVCIIADKTNAGETAG